MISLHATKPACAPQFFQLRQATHGRNGAILLLVLSMLTLFLMIGILLLVTATRTRNTARAFSEATNTTSHGVIQQRGLLDDALLRLLRGPASPQLPESILEDKYGSNFLSGTLTAYTDADKPLIKATIAIPASSAASPFDLGGRIVTFRPAPGDDAVVSSYRIVRVIRAADGKDTFLLANLDPGTPAALPAINRLPCEAHINGREFTPASQTAKNEPYDSYGVVNGLRSDPWLTKLSVVNSQLTAEEAAFNPNNEPATVDNDNDGIPDGIWLEGFFPDSPAADGGTLRHSVSYLVLDLDSRLNLNAHGSYSPQVYPDEAWTQPPATVPLPPAGLGAGPARVDLSVLAPVVLDTARGVNSPEAAAWPYGKVTNRWHKLLAGTLRQNEKLAQHPYGGAYDPLIQGDIATRQDTDIAYAALPEQRLPRPFMGDSTLAGRYGDDRFPGIHPRRDTLPLKGTSTAGPWLNRYSLQQFTARSDQSAGFAMGQEANVETWRIAGNSPVDLLGRLRTSGRQPPGQAVPSVVFDAPSWSNIPSQRLQDRFAELRARGFEPSDFYGPGLPGLYYPDQPVPPLSFDCEYTVQDLVNDPYEVDIGAEGNAPAVSRDSSRLDQLFTVAELEPVLRPFDQDTPTLPSRLKGLLDDLADRYRLAITTDSWDTPGLVGVPSRKVSLTAQRWNLADNMIYQMCSPDIAAGLRFNLNRPGMFRVRSILSEKNPAKPQGEPGSAIVQRINNPQKGKLVELNGIIDCFGQNSYVLPGDAGSQSWLATSARRLPDSFVPPDLPPDLQSKMDVYHVVMEDPAERQRYFTHLYTLLWMLQSTVIRPDGTSDSVPIGADQAAQLAQWAANVLEFRDPDSTMSKYDYDTNPANGWGNDPAVVFGCERPELLITETVSYDYPQSVGSGLVISLYRPWQATIRHEGRDIATERIDPVLAPDVRADSPQANSLHIGKRVVGETQPLRSSIWRLRWKPTDENNPIPPLDLGAFESDSAAVVGTNQQLLLSSVQGVPGLRINVDPTQVAGVYLERLANPHRDYSNAPDEPYPNPYIAVDYAPITLNEQAKPLEQATSQKRRSGFWRNQFEERRVELVPTVSLTVDQKGPWFHWPNRDFIGHAELMLVPFADGRKDGSTWVAPLRMLQRHGDTPYSYASKDNGAIPEILDATIVPSRFMGTAVTVNDPSTLLQGTGFSSWPCHQLSRWREPGRINLNTVLSDQPSAASSPQAQDRRKRSYVEGNGGLAPLTGADPEPVPISNAVSRALLSPPENGPWPSTSSLLLATASQNIANQGNDFVSPSAFVSPSLQSTLGDSLAPVVFLSNVATVRSHVFAIWITVKTENTMTGDARTHRMFAIIDRSIPVGYRPGLDLNVRKTIRVKRYMD
jgi:hypothetical protein